MAADYGRGLFRQLNDTQEALDNEKADHAKTRERLDFYKKSYEALLNTIKLLDAEHEELTELRKNAKDVKILEEEKKRAEEDSAFYSSLLSTMTTTLFRDDNGAGINFIVNSLHTSFLAGNLSISSATSAFASTLSDVVVVNADMGALLAQVESLQQQLDQANAQIGTLTEKNAHMNRIANTNSGNSSKPESQEGIGVAKARRAANEYNSRVQNKGDGVKPNPRGHQKGVPGCTLTMADVEQKLASNALSLKQEIVLGDPTAGDPIIRYQIGVRMIGEVTKYIIYPDSDGHRRIPSKLKKPVTYDESFDATAALFYTEGAVSIDRIADMINGLSCGALSVGYGTVYNALKRVAKKYDNVVFPSLSSWALKTKVGYTDATYLDTDGHYSYARNFSTDNYVLYFSLETKTLEELENVPFFQNYKGILVHDHETIMYHFGSDHGECNVHLCRYLTRNSEETGHTWSGEMRHFLNGMNKTRKALMAEGRTCFTLAELQAYEAKYDSILAKGYEEHYADGGMLKEVSKDEMSLLGRLKTYKHNHLLFIYNWDVNFSNNMSENDLRHTKTKENVSGCFRTKDGRAMYLKLLSYMKTLQRQKLQIMWGFQKLCEGELVLHEVAE